MTHFIRIYVNEFVVNMTTRDDEREYARRPKSIAIYDFRIISFIWPQMAIRLQLSFIHNNNSNNYKDNSDV